MIVDFELPQKWLDPKNHEHILLVAKRIVAIRYGQQPEHANVVEMQNDGSVNFPLTNDHWLFPPEQKTDRKKNHWRLVSRYDNKESLDLIVKALILWL
ncbi:MAG: hypothetical protein KBC21_02685 [Candidatus Pacebacteria bacterium]|jgi:hypothetical protein|nr:hypothetical protein [Candidatus Paceibacterota bacterium]